MTILLYDYCELEEKASKHLRAWKVWHILLFILAAVFGVMNYTFLFKTKELVNDRCVFNPRNLEFHWVEVELKFNDTDKKVIDKIVLAQNNSSVDNSKPSSELERDEGSNGNITNENKNSANAQSPVQDEENRENKTKVTKREVNEFVTSENVTTVEEQNVTLITENTTHRLVLDVVHTYFQRDTCTSCQFPEYMPLLSAMFAIVWLTLFIMCPNGGRTRSGLKQPYRILIPAMIFSFVMVILTGISFTSTNSGLQAFCAAFHNYTNSTACSPVNQYLELSYNSSWGVGGRIAAARASAAGVWASWAVAAALFLARCLAAPDFVVMKTSVHLKDPGQKLTPHLRKSKSQRSPRAANSSPNKHDAVSVRSEPTITTELVTASIERELDPDSQPTSLATTPLKERYSEEIEMAQNP